MIMMAITPSLNASSLAVLITLYSTRKPARLASTQDEIRDGFVQASVCVPANEVDAGVIAIRAPWGLDALGEADTIIVPGLAAPTSPVPENVLDALRTAAEGGTQMASICVGTFTLAAAGLLDGLSSPTAAGRARRSSPRKSRLGANCPLLRS